MGLFLLVTSGARASDGALEINQACAVDTGCFPGDAPGFPVEITQPGRYVLTGNLTIAGIGADAVLLAADFVTLDLVGFGIIGPGQGVGDGISDAGGAQHVVVHDGFVTAMGGHCVDLDGGRQRVEGMTIEGCGGDGIRLGGLGVARSNRVYSCSGTGLVLDPDDAFQDNFLANNGVDVSGGRSLGGNLCSDQTCSPHLLRRYYLTTLTANGANAANPGNCADGFHFASLYEIQDLGQLQYDTSRGEVLADSAPPTALEGWIRDRRYFVQRTDRSGRRQLLRLVDDPCSRIDGQTRARLAYVCQRDRALGGRPRRLRISAATLVRRVNSSVAF